MPMGSWLRCDFWSTRPDSEHHGVVGRLSLHITCATCGATPSFVSPGILFGGVLRKSFKIDEVKPMANKGLIWPYFFWGAMLESVGAGVE